MCRPLQFALLAAACGTAAPTHAHAQKVSIYGTFSYNQFSNVRNGCSSVGCPGNDGYSTINFGAPGYGGGVTVNVLFLGPFRFGFDFRGANGPGTNGGGIGMFGARFSAKTPILKLKPYIEGAGGYLATHTNLVTSILELPAGTASDDRFWVYEFFAGIDYPLMHFLDLRIVEFGAGQGLNVDGTHTTNGNYNIPIISVNSGVVFHF